jgi:hypothetical protein
MAEITPAPSPASERRQINVVTSENRAEYMAERMRAPTVAPAPSPSPAAEPAKDAKKDPIPAFKDKKVEPEADEHAEPRKNGIQQRFSELTGARKEAERQAQEARDEAVRLKAELQALKTTAKPADAEPRPENFKDAFEFAKALSAFEVKKALRERDEAETKRKDDERKAAEDAQREQNAKSWKTREDKTRADIDDYDEVVNSAPPGMTRELSGALFESEIGPRVAYYLALNPEEHQRLMKLTPTKMIREFDKIEDAILKQMGKPTVVVDKKSGEKEAAAAAKPVRRAQEPPEPITTVAGTGSSAPSSILDEKGNVTGSYSDYKAARKAGRIR